MSMIKDTKIRLNLGSGEDYIKGWINVDINKENKVDVIADINREFPFNENYADEIKASDILEHFIKEDGERFLNECHRVLKKDGILFIRTHNIFKIFHKFEEDPEVLIHFLYGDTSETKIFGSHKFAFTKESLTRLLRKIGFEIISCDEEETNFVIKARKIENISKKINIGVIMQSPDIGGAETFMLSLIDQFKKNDNEIFLASNRGKFLSFAKEKNIETYEIPIILDIIGNLRGLIKTILSIPYAFYYYFGLLRQFKRNKVDIILMSNFTEKLFVTALSPMFKVPVVWIEYGNLHEVFKKNFYLPKVFYRMLNKIPKSIIVPSKNTMDSLIKDARVSLGRIKLVALGVKDPHGVHKKHEGFVIGNVSRLALEKGQQYLIRSMPFVLKKAPDARLLIIGDGPNKKNLQELVISLNLNKNVKILGFTKNLDYLYEGMDVFVFPSTWELEGFGLVLVEAMSHRLPVIAAINGPTSEIVINEKTGLLVESKNEKSIATAVIELAKNHSKRNFLGENGYKRFVDKYTIDKSVKSIMEILYEATIN